MPRVGRALREKLRSDAEEARHPGRGRRRVLLAEASAAAVADREARFPALSAENAEAAIRYQEERIAHHRARLGVSDADLRAAEKKENPR